MAQWFAQAPSNIALIKYMGKSDSELNLPINASLSFTVPHLLSSVMLESHSGKADFWEPLETPGAETFTLSVIEQERFLKHLQRLKKYFNYTGGFMVRSTNNFPRSSGLASSASSFAALTKCAVLALSELNNLPLPSVEKQAGWSRLGSGSSCRSFFSPWALWEGDKVEARSFPYYEHLLHRVIIMSHAEKKISSSEAHARIKTSPFYAERAQRAQDNLKRLLPALEKGEWKTVYEVCWQEFHDMHQLFETASEPFSYFSPEIKEMLARLQEIWQKTGDGPIITMDAGPNIHVLYRLDQKEQGRQFYLDYLIGNYDVL